MNQHPFKAAPDSFLQWLDHSPDLADLSDVFPEQFPYLLESSARGALGSHSLLLFAGDNVLVLDADGGVSGPGKGDSFFTRLESWYQGERTGFSATIEEGKLADLIVVSSNPLDNISNIRKLQMVFKDGKRVNLEKDEGQSSIWDLYFW